MNDTFWDSARMTMTESIEYTVNSVNAFSEKHDHWAIAYSGGKDSSLLATLIPHLILKGKIRKPKTLIVLYADTLMELPPLQFSAMGVMEELRKRGIETRIVKPVMDDRFFVYMFGRGVPPPSNTFRWCTSQIKIEPMINALKELRTERAGKFLMMTGVRLGESAARDGRIALSCGKNGAECGQGWFQETTPEDVADTLAPILHWRVCLVWKWLRDYAPEFGFPTAEVAAAYGGNEAEEINARTGCVGCNLATRDVALETILKVDKWKYLSPLLRLRPLYAELKKPWNRLRKDGTERRKDGVMVMNPQRMGPLTFEARLMGLETILQIQRDIAAEGKPYILIDPEEESRIRHLIEEETWPNGWTGNEPRADLQMDDVISEGVIQPLLLRI